MHSSLFFFFNDTATTEIYTLSLHDALPILALSMQMKRWAGLANPPHLSASPQSTMMALDRKSTRLNSSHGYISYAVFCLKKKIEHLSLSEEELQVLNSLNLSPSQVLDISSQ